MKIAAATLGLCLLLFCHPLEATGATGAASATGTTIRYALTPGQVLVYRAVADVEIEGRGETGRRDRRRESTTHIELVFSYTAGKRLPNGDTALTIEVLDLSIVHDTEFERGQRRVEANADGVKVYEDGKLVQASGWDKVTLPSGLNGHELLTTPIEARVTELGTIGGFADAEKVKRLLRGANLLHLLMPQPVFSADPIGPGSFWDVERPLSMANPLRYRELYQLAGGERFTAEAAVTNRNRRCLRLSIKGTWPSMDIEGSEAKASGTGTAIVDFATGVLFSYSGKTRQSLEGSAAGAEADFDAKSSIQVEYIGGAETAQQYKAKRPK